PMLPGVTALNVAERLFPPPQKTKPPSVTLTVPKLRNGISTFVRVSVALLKVLEFVKGPGPFPFALCRVMFPVPSTWNVPRLFAQIPSRLAPPGTRVLLITISPDSQCTSLKLLTYRPSSINIWVPLIMSFEKKAVLPGPVILPPDHTLSDFAV